MSFKIDNITQRKNVVKYQTQTVIEPRVIIEKPTEIHKIISNSSYTTNNETFLIVKNVTNKITIKSLTSVLVKSDVGSIDEEWDEILLEKGACVKFKFVEGNWYILSSDGLKLG